MGLFRTIISGNSPAAGEVWSIGLNWTMGEDAAPQSAMTAWATNIGTAIAASSGNQVFQMLSSSGNISKVRTEQRDDTDNSLLMAGEYTLPIPETGANPPTSTLQTAMCISLITILPGRSNRGRCYWPAWAYTPTSSLLFGTSQQTNALTGFKALIDLIKAQAAVTDPAWVTQLIVWSRLNLTAAPVVTIAAGSVPDTQRRRRDAIKEVYTTLAL